MAGGFAFVLLLAGIEFVKVTPPITPVNTPPFYQQLGKDPDRYAILELPIYKSGDEDQWFSYQAIHHKYLFGGNLARKQSHSFAENTPVLNWFAAKQPPAPDIVPSPPISVALDVLRWANVRYVTLIKQPVAEQNLSSEQALIKTVWGASASPAYSDSIMDVYQVPTTTLTSTATISPMMAVSDGWYTFETDNAGGHRWISGSPGNHDASITILSLGASGNYTLTFRAFSYAHPYQVEVRYLDRVQATMTINPAPQTFALPLHIYADRNVFTFHVLGEPTSPKASGAGGDERFLSVGFGNLNLQQ